MRRFPFCAGLSIAVFALTAVGCSGNQTPSSGGSAAGGASSGGASASGSGGTGGSSSTVVSSGTGGATGTTGTGGTTATTGGSTGGSGGNGTASGGTASGGTASGGTASGGTTATGGASARGGSAGAASGGARTGGAVGSGGTVGAGGVVGTGGSTVDAGTPAACGATPNPNPFGCSFAWGTNGGTPSSLTYLQFISNWAGYGIRADGTFASFDNSGWLRTMSTATQIPAYYAYLLGYYGHANNLPDGNVNPNGPNLTTGMGTLLLGVDNAACPQGPPAVICADNLMVKAYAYYATQTYAAYKKPVIWLLEGDLIQYSPSSSQTQKLTWTQFGQLVAQIIRAIKCNDPPAVVAVDYSSWMSNATMLLFFDAINTEVANLGTSYEMVWTTGKGTSANAGSGTTWAQLYAASGGKPILSDESFGLSAASDSWANQSAATINSRIAGGVQAVNITTSPLPSYLQTNVTTMLAPSALDSTCP